MTVRPRRMPPSGSWVRGLLAAAMAAFLAVLVATPADAHVKSTTGYSVIRSDGNEVRYQLLLEFSVLARSAGLGGAAEDATDDDTRRAALRDRQEEAADYLADRVIVYLDDVACEGELSGADVETRDRISYAVLDLSFACPGSPEGSYRVHYQVFSLSEGMVDDHVNVVDYELGGEQGRAALDGRVSDLVTGERSFVSSTARFGGLGVEHILSGLDHVLFVVALLLGATSLGAVAKVVSTFTLAHSLTLGLAVLGWVHVPAQIVEPLIALSIAYVALESVLGGRSRHRLAVVFGFGLLHGLGFASALRFTDELSWGLIWSLAGFNLGIEVGQVLFILVLFPLLLLIRRLPRLSSAVHLGAAGTIAVLGLVWFVQRVALA